MGSGGTLRIVVPTDFEHLDPQRTYATQAMAVEQLLVRKLTTWVAPGDGGPARLTPDLAVDTGTPSEGNRTWTFRLKPGVSFETGAPITAQDVKYGVERAFAPEITGGAPYAKLWLAGGDDYQGPFEGHELDSIQTPDRSTIIFRLNRPVADFDEATALNTFSPVPRDLDTHEQYDDHPVASGPYRIRRYVRGRELILERNPHWDPASDGLREQNVDRVEVLMGQDDAEIDAYFRTRKPGHEQALNLYPVAGRNQQDYWNDPDTRKLCHLIETPLVSFLALNTSRARLKDVNVRRAIAFAVDQRSFRDALGGEVVGDIATSFIPPGIEGRQDFRPFAKHPEGDPQQAGELLRAAGLDGLSLTLCVQDTETMRQAGEAIRVALCRAGIAIEVTPIAKSEYFATITRSDHPFDLVWAHWMADWPSAGTVLPPLFDGRMMAADPLSHYNFAQLDNAEVNQRITEIGAMTDSRARHAAWGDLDRYVLTELAPVVPLVYMKQMQMAGDGIGGLRKNTAIGQLDFTRAHVVR